MTKRFEFTTTRLAGLLVVNRKPIHDSRGFFSRFFCAREFEEAGFQSPIAQINQTLTVRAGTVRGMHFQRPPHSEVKIVTCVRGKVFDVAVDIRKNSPTFLQWHGEYLSAESQKSLYIPEGFAHGFQTLESDCELFYLHSRFFEPSADDALNARDPRLSIEWPSEITDMSDRDRGHATIDGTFNGIELL